MASQVDGQRPPNRTRSERLFQQSLVHVEREKLRKAHKKVQRLIKRHPEDQGRSLFLLAHLEKRLGMTSKARQHFRKLALKYPYVAEYAFQAGQLALHAHHLDSAAVFYAQAKMNLEDFPAQETTIAGQPAMVFACLRNDSNFFSTSQTTPSTTSDSGTYFAQLLGFNTTSMEVNALPFQTKTLLVSSSVYYFGLNPDPTEHRFTTFPLDIYLNNPEEPNDEATGLQRLPFRINRQQNETVCDVRGDTVFFIRNIKQHHRGQSIWKSVAYRTYLIQGRKWSQPEEIHLWPTGLLVKEFCFTRDFTEAYLSVREAGNSGNADLYFLQKGEDGWGSPQLLGPNINTLGDERFPRVDAEGNLYFSSNGYAGFGGRDILKINPKVPSSKPEILGAGINSSRDELSFYPLYLYDDSIGLVSSNRYHEANQALDYDILGIRFLPTPPLSPRSPGSPATNVTERGPTIPDDVTRPVLESISNSHQTLNCLPLLPFQPRKCYAFRVHGPIAPHHRFQWSVNRLPLPPGAQQEYCFDSSCTYLVQLRLENTWTHENYLIRSDSIRIDSFTQPWLSVEESLSPSQSEDLQEQNAHRGYHLRIAAASERLDHTQTKWSFPDGTEQQGAEVRWLPQNHPPGPYNV
ncbi:MAG: hypothetical protein AAF570_13150, partial [Bacteroidota bacterium]